jgi:methionyl-tRNA synthetase
LLNDHVTERAPWILIKDPVSVSTAAGVIYALLDSLRLVLNALYPVMPRIASRGLAVLGQTSPAQSFGTPYVFETELLAAGTAFGPADVLFPRLDD